MISFFLFFLSNFWKSTVRRVVSSLGYMVTWLDVALENIFCIIYQQFIYETASEVFISNKIIQHWK